MVDPKETLALPQPVDQLSLTTLREMLIEAVKADELDKALLAAKKERAAVMRKR